MTGNEILNELALWPNLLAAKTAFGSADGRVVGGPAEIAIQAFTQQDFHCKAYRWWLYTQGIELDRYSRKVSSRTGERL